MREIMYVGRKPTHWDTKNGNPKRVWRGLGDVIAVSDIEAKGLGEHPDAWLDVTDLKPKDRSAKVTQIREERREELRAQVAGQVTLRSASIEELEAELKLRRTASGKPDQNPSKPGPKQAPKGSALNPGDEREKPETLAGVIEDIAGALAGMDPENPSNFDQTGRPHIEAVNEAVGYVVTEDQLNAAVKVLQEPPQE